VMAGSLLKATESCRYAGYGSDKATLLQDKIKTLREALPKRVNVETLKDLIMPLCSMGFIDQVNKKVDAPGGRSVSFTTLSLTRKGWQILNDANAPIMMRVPASVRKQEEEDKVKLEKRKKELTSAGIDIDAIPVKELADGEGPTYDAYAKWTRTLKRLEESDDPKQKLKGTQLVDLKERIIKWRLETATLMNISPHSVAPEHLILKVAYASSKGAMTYEALEGVGVRAATIDQLVKVLGVVKLRQAA
jgi:hypothetical protein